MTDDTCYPYTSGNGDPDICSETCPSGNSDYYKYQCEPKSLFVSLTDDGKYFDNLIKFRLTTTGPMHMTLAIYESWEKFGTPEYTGDVYQPLDGEKRTGWETVMLIGYGVD